MIDSLLLAFSLLSSRVQGADAPLRSSSQCITEKLELLAVQPKGTVVPGGSTQLFLGAFNDASSGDVFALRAGVFDNATVLAGAYKNMYFSR